MTGYLTDYKGQQFKLPSFLSWDITHTDGTDGTDSFQVSFAYDKDMNSALGNAVYFSFDYKGKRVFYGVVDEYEINIGTEGKTASLMGRGMGARLIDNKCEGAEYVSCTLSEMLRNYVSPFGVETAQCDALPPMYGYSVSTGESAMTALTGYTKFAGDIVPRFSPEGKLLITKKSGSRYALNTDCVLSAAVRERRCGVLSKVKVLTVDGVQMTAENESFLKKGGCAQGVITVPRKTAWDMMRYTGEYQIEKSESGAYTLEVTVPELFCAYPCDICTIDSEFCKKGEYRVFETCCFGTERGMGTVIKLVKEEA